MNKKVIIINIHSFIDVITNSSTELFVTDDAKSITAVKEMLQFMLNNWNNLAAGGAFGDHYVKNKRFAIGKKSIPKPIKTFDETFGDIYLYTQEMYEKDIKEYEEWKLKNQDSGYSILWGYEKKENIGKIFIVGASDNEIPSEMFDWIQSAFGWDTQRYHLG